MSVDDLPTTISKSRGATCRCMLTRSNCARPLRSQPSRELSGRVIKVTWLRHGYLLGFSPEGRRSVKTLFVIVSDSFLSQTLGDAVSRTSDRALHAGTIIDALDAHGFFVVSADPVYWSPSGGYRRFQIHHFLRNPYNMPDADTTKRPQEFTARRRSFTPCPHPGLRGSSGTSRSREAGACRPRGTVAFNRGYREGAL